MSRSLYLEGSMYPKRYKIFESSHSFPLCDKDLGAPVALCNFIQDILSLREVLRLVQMGDYIPGLKGVQVI